MKITKMKVAELKPLEVNVRRHNERQIQELARSVKAFGQTRAIVIDEENNILIGNGPHAALMHLGMTECFVFRKTGLKETEKKKLILADNKTFSLGVDDYANIEAYLSDITATGDFDIAGFDEESLRGLMRDAEEVLADAKGYGVLPESTVNQNKQTAERIEKRAEAAASHPQDTGTFIAPDDGESAQEDSGGNGDGVRQIICPSCGEVINVD